MIDAKEKYVRAILGSLSTLSVIEHFNFKSDKEMNSALLKMTGYQSSECEGNLYVPVDTRSSYYLFSHDIDFFDSVLTFYDLDGKKHTALQLSLDKSKVNFPLFNVVVEKVSLDDDREAERSVVLINNEIGFYYEKIVKKASKAVLREGFCNITSECKTSSNLVNILLDKTKNVHYIDYVEGEPVFSRDGERQRAYIVMDEANKRISDSLEYLEFSLGLNSRKLS